MTDGIPGTEPLRITDNPEERRYEAWIGDRLAGKAEYRIVGDRIIFFHTEIDPDFEGHGLGSRLVRATLDDVRARALRVTPKCPFFSAWIARHPDYSDLVALRPGGEPTG